MEKNTNAQPILSTKENIEKDLLMNLELDPYWKELVRLRDLETPTIGYNPATGRYEECVMSTEQMVYIQSKIKEIMAKYSNPSESFRP